MFNDFERSWATCIFFVQEAEGLAYAQKPIYAVSFIVWVRGSTINSTIRYSTIRWAAENKQHCNIFYFCTVNCCFSVQCYVLYCSMRAFEYLCSILETGQRYGDLSIWVVVLQRWRGTGSNVRLSHLLISFLLSTPLSRSDYCHNVLCGRISGCSYPIMKKVQGYV